MPEQPDPQPKGMKAMAITAGAVGICCLGLDLLATSGFMATASGLFTNSLPWLAAGLAILVFAVYKRYRRPVDTAGKAGSSLPQVLLAALLLSYGTYGVKTADASFFNSMGTQIGDIAPDFKLPTLDGKTFTLSAQRGKPTILFFMANWCGSCISEGQALTQLKQEYGDKISIVALDVDSASTPELLRRFKRAAGNGNYTWAFDRKQQVTALYKVRTLDTTLVLDQQGRIVYQDQWPSRYQTLKKQLVNIGL